MKQWLSRVLTVLLLLLPLAALAEIRPLPIDQSGGYPVSASNLIADGEYKDESIHIVTTRPFFKNTKCILIKVRIEDPSQLRTAMSQDDYGIRKYVPTRLLAKAKNAVVTVNGDFFKYIDGGYLVRQGTLYRDRPDGIRDVLLIDENADFYSVRQGTEETVGAAVAELEAQGHRVINSFNFGPTLVVDGQVQEFDSNMYQGKQKMMRVAIGQLGPLEYAIYFCDGSTTKPIGLTMEHFAEFVATYTPEVKVAYNLDGGGSAHVVILQRQLHSTPGGRDISDIVYFASASDLLGEREQ